ncbi:MAG TPA: glyoxalase superfamily protein [Flavisolibacter sp.]|jgi:catechol 2,3-dioxygenase-like lactoylglutathione lyase family enzyme|nr:glyoxalase superfamily protein [Flavisolibacter sp.]
MATVKPVLRIFDYQKAIAFYVHWLGFTIDWEHRFEEGAPVYLQVSRGDMVLHLSEHSGDGTPGTHVFIDDFPDLAAYHQQLLQKQYAYNRPGIEVPFYDENALEVKVIDPFHNLLILVQRNVKNAQTAS